MQTQDQQSWVERLSQSESEECLESLRSLAEQLRGAMDAIVERSLSSLQNSLHLQQVNCGRLSELRHRSMKRLGRSSEFGPASIDSDLAMEIKAATDSLLILNSNYSALLKHSVDTLRLLAGLYRSYSGFTQPGSGSKPRLQTWSCEV